MKSIRLKIDIPFLRRYLTAGMVIGLPADIADDLIRCELADTVEPERAAVVPDEKRDNPKPASNPIHRRASQGVRR
jgi:hypothetical protein